MQTKKTDKPIDKKETLKPISIYTSNPKDSANKIKEEKIKQTIEEIKEMSTTTTSKEGNQV